MTILPNWVDLIVVTVFLIACYNGFGRGLVVELLILLGAISVTALTINYSGLAARWVQSYWSAQPMLTAVLVFWGLFLILVVAMRFLLRTLTSAIKWERLHWSIQGIGLLLGGLRGLWWVGFILIALSSSGVPYLQQSVEERSVLGPRLLAAARVSLKQVADVFPGAEFQSAALIPPLQPAPAK